MGEHSPVDALIPSIIADWAISEPIDIEEFSHPSEIAPPTLEPLIWDADSLIVSECDSATSRARAIIEDSDADVLWFKDYGVNWIKAGGERITS